MRKFWLAGLMAAGAATMWAQDDPPSRVARLNFLEGSVSFQSAGHDDWAAATPNYPLTVGDHLWADDRSHAELHIGSTAIRMDAHTAIAFLNLDDRMTQLRLSDGTINISVRYMDENESYEVDTPNGAVTLLRPGRYRIDADPDRQLTTVTVRGGEAEVTAGAAFPVHARQSAYITGADQPNTEVASAGPSDDFDLWWQSRDDREDRRPAPRYVSREMIGYRWAFYGGGWVWLPGAVAVRPVYAPALVAWVGGEHFGVGIGIGAGVGWFPLGPREAYIPSYRVSNTYVTRVNVTNVTNVTNITNVTNVTYVNQRVPGAVTAVSRTDFAASRPVARVAVQVPASAVASAQVSTRQVPVTRQEAVAARRVASATIARPPQSVVRTPVVTRTPPPASTMSLARPATVPANRPPAVYQAPQQNRPGQPEPTNRPPAAQSQPTNRPPAAQTQPANRPPTVQSEPNYRPPVTQSQPTYRPQTQSEPANRPARPESTYRPPPPQARTESAPPPHQHGPDRPPAAERRPPPERPRSEKEKEKSK